MINQVVMSLALTLLIACPSNSALGKHISCRFGDWAADLPPAEKATQESKTSEVLTAFHIPGYEGVTIILGPASPSDNPTIKKIVIFPWASDKKWSVQMVRWPSRSEVAWGDAILPADKWEQIAEALDGEVDRIQKLSQKAGPVSNEQGGDYDYDRRLEFSSPFPGILKLELGSERMEDVQGITSFIYSFAQDEITGAAAVTASGLVVLDTLGGRKGLTVLTTVPLPATGVVIPKDPAAFVKNLATLPVNIDMQKKIVKELAAALIRSPVPPVPLPPVVQKPVEVITTPVRLIGDWIKKW